MTAEQTLLRLAARTKLNKVRASEFKAAEARATTEIEKYWAGSCVASVLRDYQAGRVTIIEAK